MCVSGYFYPFISGKRVVDSTAINCKCWVSLCSRGKMSGASDGVLWGQV